MADFNPVQRPVPHEDDSHKKDKKTVGTPEKFKESYRVQEVKPTGEEEKKKRKRPDEAQMEAQAEGLVAPQQVPLQTNLSPSPYSVQPPSKSVGAVKSTSAPQQSAPLGSSYSPAAQSVGAPTSTPIPEATPTVHTSPTQSPPPATPPPAPTAAPAPYVAQPTPQPTSYEEVEPAGQDYFQPTTIPSPSQPITTSQPTSAETEETDQSQQTDDTQKTDETSDTTQSQQPTSKGSSDKTQNKKGIPLGMEKAMTGADTLAAGTGQVGLTKEAKPLGTDKTGTTILDKKATPGDAARPTSTTAIESSEVKMESGSKETTAKTGLEKMSDSSQLQKGSQETKTQTSQQQALTPGMVSDAKPLQVAPPPPPVLRQKDVTVEEAGLSWEGDVQPTSALSSESSDKEKKDKNDRDNEGQNPESQTQSSIMQAPTPFAIETPGVQAPPPTYTTFSPAVLEMFDKMVGTISVLQETSGERKTTISLTSQNFSSSVFYGAEIVIEEDLHLAPGQFNIKLIGSPEAVNLFQAKRNDLMAAFQEGNYNFRVQRLETSIQSSDKPMFKRKESVGEDASKDTGEGE